MAVRAAAAGVCVAEGPCPFVQIYWSPLFLCVEYDNLLFVVQVARSRMGVAFVAA